MKTIISTAKDLLSSLDIVRASNVSPSGSFYPLHVFLTPFKEQMNPGVNLGRLPVIKISAISQEYNHTASPDWGGERSSVIAIDVFVASSISTSEQSYYDLSRIVNAVCKVFSQNTFLSIEEISVQEATELNHCVASRIILTLKSITDENFEEGD
jgi:hypothetical protein